MASDIADWLSALDLDRFIPVFESNEISVRDLELLTEDDLIELGLPLGPRRRIANAITELGASVSENVASVAHSATGSDEASDSKAAPKDAERRQLTVMFVDLVGSTELSARLDPEDLRGVMQRYQTTVADVIAANDGYLANWLGDGVIAYFGWPNAGEDQATRAVHAGLQAVDAVGRLPLFANTDEMLAARVGIATGQVVVGDLQDGGIGPKDMVTGETPNLAARLQGLAVPGGVVIGPVTHALVQTRFQFEHLGGQALKGFEDLVEAWSVRATMDEDDPSEVPGIHQTIFTGRTHEVGLLLDRWDQAKAGEGQVVLVSGEPGIGKSRIVRAFRERIEGDTYRRILYQCSPHHEHSALFPAIQQLEKAAGFVPGESSDEKLDKLETVLRAAMPEIEQMAPLIAALLSIPADARYGPSMMSSGQQRAATLLALQDQLIGLASHEPVLFVLEDAHWVDPTTVEMITTILSRLIDQRIMMLITHRPEWQDPFQSFGQITRLNLSRLSRAQVAAIVRDIAGRDAPEEAITRVVERTDGIPLFVEELTKAVAEAGFDLSDDEVPATLQASLMARLDRLGPAKEIAQVGSVIGREFDRDLLAQTLDRNDDLDDALETLISSQLIFRTRRDGDDTYTFKHALVQDIAYDSLLRPRRQALHLAIASALAGSEAPVAEVLARHFELGGDRPQAFEWARRASIDAAKRSAQPETVAHSANALRLLGSDADADVELPLLIRLGHAQIGALGGGSPEMLKTFGKAGALAAKAQNSKFQVVAKYGQYVGRMISGNPVRASEIAREAIEIGVKAGSDWMEFVGWRMYSGSEFLLGHLSEADRALELVLAHGPETHSRLPDGFAHDPVATLASMRTHIEWVTGRREQALSGSTAAVERAQASGADPNAVSYALTWDIYIGMFERDPVRIERSGKQLTDHTKQTGGVFWEQIGNWALGTAKVLCGEYAAGQELIQSSIDTLEASGTVQHIPMNKLSHAEALYHLGDLEGALLVLDQSRAIIERTEQRAYEPEMHRWRGIVLQGTGQLEEAEAAYRQAIDVADEQGSVIWLARAKDSYAAFRAQQTA